MHGSKCPPLLNTIKENFTPIRLGSNLFTLKGYLLYLVHHPGVLGLQAGVVLPVVLRSLLEGLSVIIYINISLFLSAFFTLSLSLSLFSSRFYCQNYFFPLPLYLSLVTWTSQSSSWSSLSLSSRFNTPESLIIINWIVE